MHNSRTPGTVPKISRFIGVTRGDTTGKFRAWLKIEGKTINVGLWDRERDAAIARDRAVLHFGVANARLNLARASKKLGPASPAALVSLARKRGKAKSGASSQYIGVTWDSRRRRWAAFLRVGDEHVLIARFHEEKDAAVAYDRVARHELHRRGALNFPEHPYAPASMEQVRREARRLVKLRKTSKYRGVSWQRIMGAWTANIYSRGKTHPLGYFSDECSAALAYDRAARRLHGRKALLNFPR
jgi:hypothetical protein